MKDNKIEFISNMSDTILNVLSNKLNGYSNKTIKQYLKNNMVYINNEIVNHSNIEVKINDLITFYIKKAERKYELDIIYEDNDILVINKPNGLLSVSNDNEKEITAFRLVSNYVKEKDKNNKIFLIHRLDMETSGILMFAKNTDIQNKLYKNWNNIVKLREYHCVIPRVVTKKGHIESYLKVEKNNIVHSIPKGDESLKAITDYSPIKNNDKYTLLKVEISTGKRNQIRVHMKENISPICGDKKYGSKSNPINRLCLHASKLSLIDPRTNKIIEFSSNIPEEFIKLI